jgi:NAD(P)-dependent dehydrogenase (short-subunit alcohol dehydrogenase family)
VIHVSSSAGQLDSGADRCAPGYCVSKPGLNGVTAQLATALPEFAVNSVCAGWGAKGHGRFERELSIVWLATDAPQKLSGTFIKERKEIPW